MKQEVSQKEIGKRIQDLRKKRHMRVVEVAEKLGITRQHVYNLESGKKSLTVERLQQIRTVFNVNVDELLGRKRRKSA